jgi:hypothetical protein
MLAKSDVVVTPRSIVRSEEQFDDTRVPLPFSLSNIDDDGKSEIIFDYGTCQGGIPVFTITSASGPDDRIPFQVTYSETREGIDHEKGK